LQQQSSEEESVQKLIYGKNVLLLPFDSAQGADQLPVAETFEASGFKNYSHRVQINHRWLSGAEAPVKEV